MNGKRFSIGVSLTLLSSVCSSLGQLAWKLIPMRGSAVIYYFSGLALYALGALLMIIAFRNGDMSALHPMLSFGYIIAAVMGTVWLHERITLGKAVGTALIVAGAVFTASGGTDSRNTLTEGTDHK